MTTDKPTEIYIVLHERERLDESYNDYDSNVFINPKPKDFDHWKSYRFKPIRVVPHADLLKWKARCASLTAEVLCLRLAIETDQRGIKTGAGLLFYEMNIEQANRIRDEREAEIIKDAESKGVK